MNVADMRSKTETEIWDLLNEEWQKLTFAQKRLWEIIKVGPEKWNASSYEFRPYHAWVIGIIGKHIIWYQETWFGNSFNDMDSGFCCSNYYEYGMIGSELNIPGSLGETLQFLLNQIIGEFSSIPPVPPST